MRKPFDKLKAALLKIDWMAPITLFSPFLLPSILPTFPPTRTKEEKKQKPTITISRLSEKKKKSRSSSGSIRGFRTIRVAEGRKLGGRGRSKIFGSLHFFADIRSKSLGCRLSHDTDVTGRTRFFPHSHPPVHHRSSSRKKKIERLAVTCFTYRHTPQPLPAGGAVAMLLLLLPPLRKNGRWKASSRMNPSTGELRDG